MNVEAWLLTTSKVLSDNSIDTARLDTEVLLADELQKDRSWLVAHADDAINIKILERLNSKANQRAQHIPLAYIRNKQEFYGRDFYVNSHVLVPRPESEAIIELLKELELPPNARIADVGCGSGCLGITAALERPDTVVSFLDIDKNALAVTKKNASSYGLTGQEYYQGNLLEAHPEEYDVLICNLPYVPQNYPVNEATKHEPKIALFSGADGLVHYRTLFKQLQTKFYGNPIILAEALLNQQSKLKKIAEESGWKFIRKNGLALLFETYEQDHC